MLVQFLRGGRLWGVLATAVVAAAAAAQQDAPVQGPGDAEAPPLLREGSYVLQVRGTLHRRVTEGPWVFRVTRDDPRRPLYELMLLPCTLAAHLEQLVESMPDQEVVFDLTGQVFVYRGRNYLLPTHAPQLVDYIPPPTRVLEPPPAAKPARPQDAESILRELDRAVGPVARSPRVAAPPAPAAAPGPLLPPGTVILWRRGRLVPDGDGAWTLVFDADASGLADPPMVLMPCLLLERMEELATSADAGPLLVSGRVYRYHGRNYLMPTSYQVPRERTPLRP